MGGLDLFKAPRISATEWKWGAPENLKAPFNSPADDFGIVFDGKKKKGYLTSNRVGTKGADDIWMFLYEACISPLSGVVRDSVNGGIPVRNALVVLNYQDGTQETTRTGADGSYNFKIGENETFIVSVKVDSLTSSARSKNYFLLNAEKQNGRFTTVGSIECNPNNKDFIVEPAKDDAEIVFPAVLYDLGLATLRPESKDSLNFLYQLLIDNPTLVIELDAHTDCRGSSESNRDLAQRRAQSCVDYLISKGISKDRLVAKGFGEDHPLKLGNVVLTEKYINSRPASEREALHQLNRRTTFRVISTTYVDPNAPKTAPTPPVKIRKGYYDESGDEISDDNSDSDETPVPVTPK
jgi:peptidoglycan-associated lipoprotein